MRLTHKTKSVLIALAFLLIGSFFSDSVKSQFWKIVHHIPTVNIKPHTGAADAVIQLPTNKYPETVKHIRDAIKSGESAVCTIDRKGADHNRDLSLAGIPTKKGYDRDEWPMAMCAEGGSGADIRYIKPADNRGAGSWIANKLRKYPDGTRVRFQ